MQKKYYDKEYVLKNILCISERQLDRAIKKVSERHPLESKWIVIRNAPNGETTIYLCTEFIKWIEEVYLKDGYYLDLEINFYESLLKELEVNSEIQNEVLKYNDMSVDDMVNFFKRDKENIRVAISKMNKSNSEDLKYYKGDILYIRAKGIKWINEKYYRKDYLKYLESQKQLMDGNIV